MAVLAELNPMAEGQENPTQSFESSLVPGPTSSATNSGQRPFYAPEMDALRFCAFLMVFCRHITSQFAAIKGQANQLAASVHDSAHSAAPVTAQVATDRFGAIQGFTQSMDFGVCLFFFLSSFLITRLLLIERKATGEVKIADFYVRRSLRIWPLYFTFLVAVVVLSHWVPVLHVERSRLLVSVFFVANWAAVLHGWASVSIQPLWSVSVEEQFYAFWPWLARAGEATIVKVSVVLAALSLMTLFYLGSVSGTQVTNIWPNTLVQMIFFAAGACTAVFSTPETRRMKTGKRVALLVAGLIAWVSASAGFHVVRTNSPGAISLVLGYLMVLLGTFLIFSAVAGWRATVIPAWLTYLGRISYGLYVFHVACLLLVEQAVLPRLSAHLPSGTRSLLLAESVMSVLGLIMTLVCAMVSYQLLEKPFLRLKKRFTVVSSRPA
jgi:peptidoglycan/LPS O-acetylase OafA/YrhL